MHPYGHPCHDEDCPACQSLAEQRAEDPGYADDWRIGELRYERWLDVVGGSR
jgi:hypothetical protein